MLEVQTRSLSIYEPVMVNLQIVTVGVDGSPVVQVFKLMYK